MNAHRPKAIILLIRIIAAVLLVAYFALAASCSETKANTPGTAGTSGKTADEITLPLVHPRIVVQKAQRKLVLYSDGNVLRTYRTGLGFNPTGHKRREGDGRTPEGTYYICCKNPNSRFYLSLGLSYPNAQDAQEGLSSGAITQREYEKITRAIRRKATPPWNTALGGEIFIHGRGSHRDWTLGCIALEDGDIQELYELVSTGTPVFICP